MSTLKVNTINAATSGQAVAVDISNPKSFRNLIINGAMNVAQRGTSSTSDGYHTVDRFKHQYGGENEAPTFAQHALTSSDTGPWEKGFRNSFHITNGNQTGGAGAGDYTHLVYKVEAQDMANSGWDYTSASSYITLSFWVKASVAQTYQIWLYTDDGTGQGYASTFALSANTWTKVTKTIPGNSNIQFDNNNGQGLEIAWQPFIGTNYTDSSGGAETWGTWSGTATRKDMTSTWWTTNDATFEITGVQLEVGSYATDFEHRSYADELELCKRYYYKLGGGSWLMVNAHAMRATSYRIKGYQTHHPEMRTGPTVSSNGSGGFETQSGDSSLNGNMVLESVWTNTNQPTNTFMDWSPSSGTVSGSEGDFVVLYTGNNDSQTLEFSAEL